jgi:hypothetical protein
MMGKKNTDGRHVSLLLDQLADERGKKGSLE